MDISKIIAALSGQQQKPNGKDTMLCRFTQQHFENKLDLFGDLQNSPLSLAAGDLLAEFSKTMNPHVIVAADSAIYPVVIVGACKAVAIRHTMAGTPIPTAEDDPFVMCVKETGGIPLALVVTSALRDGRDVLSAVAELRKVKAKVVGAWALIDFEEGGMANLADANIPLTRVFTKQDLVEHAAEHGDSHS